MLLLVNISICITAGRAQFELLCRMLHLLVPEKRYIGRIYYYYYDDKANW